MSSVLDELLQAGALSPLARFFAAFIAERYRCDEDGPLALSAALVSERNRQGDVCVDLRRFAGAPLFAAEAGPPVPRGPALATWTTALQSEAAVGKPGELAPLILDGPRLYLHRLWQYEQRVCKAIETRLQAVPLDRERLRDGLARLFADAPAEGGVDWQRLASAQALTRRFAVISGGPGTGKTTTVVKVLALLLEQDPAMRIRLAAPTGKAAARLLEAIRQRKAGIDIDPGMRARIPDQATTLHRLLGFDGHRFAHGPRNPLLLDCLVIDEASMIDLPMMARLLTALPAQARVILLGDRDQLASVEAGNVLGDITGHGQSLRYSPAQAEKLATLTRTPVERLPVDAGAPPIADAIALLRTSYRFDAHSGIGRLARRVNAGEGDAALSLLGGDPSAQLHWHVPAGETLCTEAVEWAVRQYGDYLQCEDIDAALEAFERIRVLCALRGGPLGVEEVNRLIAGRLRARGLLGAAEECHGKPVMVTRNDYEVELFNGDIGLLWRSERGGLRAWFRTTEGGLRDLPVRSLPEHVPAWALTVHKSQGSEFERVLLVLPHDADNPLLTRELVYTGITRARRKLHLHASPAVLQQACRGRVRRSSGLAGKLGWGDD